jgi:hypothetical protein
VLDGFVAGAAVDPAVVLATVPAREAQETFEQAYKRGKETDHLDLRHAAARGLLSIAKNAGLVPIEDRPFKPPDESLFWSEESQAIKALIEEADRIARRRQGIAEFDQKHGAKLRVTPDGEDKE